jgi:hypothetical protein
VNWAYSIRLELREDESDALSTLHDLGGEQGSHVIHVRTVARQQQLCENVL